MTIYAAQGYRAAKQGKGYEFNPYLPTSHEAREWLDGWLTRKHEQATDVKEGSKRAYSIVEYDAGAGELREVRYSKTGEHVGNKSVNVPRNMSKKRQPWEPVFSWWCTHSAPKASRTKALKLGSSSYAVCKECGRAILGKRITNKGVSA